MTERGLRGGPSHESQRSPSDASARSDRFSVVAAVANGGDVAVGRLHVSIRPMASSSPRSLTRPLAFIALASLLACSSGTAPSSNGLGSSGSSTSTATASCTVKLSGAVQSAASCRAIVGYYEGKLSMAVLQDDDAREQPTFRFAVQLSSSDTLSPGTFGPSNVEAAAASVEKDDAGAGNLTWQAAFQNGTNIGSFQLSITAAGAEKDDVYVGTTGSLDATLEPIGHDASNVTAHVEFVSIGR